MKAKWPAIPVVASTVAAVLCLAVFTSAKAVPTSKPSADESLTPVRPDHALPSVAAAPGANRASQPSEANPEGGSSGVPAFPSPSASGPSTSRAGDGDGDGDDGGGGGGTGGGGPHCYSGSWPVGVKPTHPGQAGGVYLRGNGNAVVLEVTHHGGRTVGFSGTVTTDGSFLVTPFRLEPEDTFTLSPDGHTLTFAFVNHGALDGVSLMSVCGSTMALQADSGSHPARLIRIGAVGPPGERLGTPVTMTRKS